MKVVTGDWRSNDGCSPLEEEQQTKGIGQLVQAQEVN
jgi:hypothetical protein